MGWAVVDEIDRQLERVQYLDDASLAEVRNKAATMSVGNPGVCEWCGEDSPRLVRGACARCRDKYKLP